MQQLLPGLLVQKRKVMVPHEVPPQTHLVPVADFEGPLLGLDVQQAMHLYHMISCRLEVTKYTMGGLIR
jgi:hypothetical protein